MSINKLNVFHWHIIDATSFPFVSETHPELSGMGSYDNQTKIYQPNDIASFVQYAQQYGVRVVPEFDTPAHTFAISLSHPEVRIPCHSFGINLLFVFPCHKLL